MLLRSAWPQVHRDGRASLTSSEPEISIMKAVAVTPGKPNSVHLAELPKPDVNDVPGGRGVLVRVLKVGVDATDREINEAKYGAAPPGYDFLVLGHESFGIVEAVGPNVRTSSRATTSPPRCAAPAVRSTTRSARPT